MKNKNSICVLAATIALPAMLFGQQTDTMKVELKEVLVTATRTEKTLENTSRSVSVITKEQLNNTACATVADFLAKQEGIYVVGNGQTPGANQSIFMRGANSNQTAVYIDGVRINDASTVNNTIDLSELMLVDVERIEIARGSHGTLYGSAAIGGVVQIFTAKADKEGLTTHATIQGGVFGASTFTGEAALTAAWRSRAGITVKGIYDKLNVDGLDATIDTVTNSNIYKNRDLDGWNKQNAGISAGYENNKWQAYASYRNLQMKTDLDLRAYVDDDNYTMDFNRNLVSGTIAYRSGSKWKFSLLSSYSDTRRTAENDSSVIDADGNMDGTYSRDEYSGKNISTDFLANYKLRGAEIIAGYSLSREEMDQSNYYYSPFFSSSSDLSALDPVTTLNSFFVQADMNGLMVDPSLHRFNLVAGTRIYSHTFFDSRFTFELNPSFKLGKSSLLYFSWSTGYNAPSLYQLYAPEEYYTYDMGYTTGLTRGNKSLQPETSESFELGIRQDLFQQRLQLRFALFHTVTSHMIDYVYLWDKNIGIDTLGNDFNRDDFRGDRYLNIGTQLAEGLEVGLSCRITEKITLSANYTYVTGNLKVGPSDFDEEQTGGNHVQLFSSGYFVTNNITIEGLVRRPTTANAQLDYSPLKNLTVGINWQYAGSRSDVYYDSYLGPYGALNTLDIDAYSLAGFQCNYSFNKHFDAGFRMENIFDKSYQEIAGFTTRGRGGYLKLTYSL